MIHASNGRWRVGSLLSPDSPEGNWDVSGPGGVTDELIGRPPTWVSWMSDGAAAGFLILLGCCELPGFTTEEIKVPHASCRLPAGCLQPAGDVHCRSFL